MNRPVPVVVGVCVAVLHARFLRLLPRIETHARIAFRGIRCPVQQEDRVQECVALGWKWFVSLSEQGKDVFAFPMAFAALLARAVKCGRKLCGQERAGDVLSFVAQARHGFRVERLPATTRSPHEDLYADPHGRGPARRLRGAAARQHPDARGRPGSFSDRLPGLAAYPLRARPARDRRVDGRRADQGR